MTHLLSGLVAATYTAFNEPLYALSRLVERVLPPSLYVHLLGDWVRSQ